MAREKTYKCWMHPTRSPIKHQAPHTRLGNRGYIKPLVTAYFPRACSAGYIKRLVTANSIRAGNTRLGNRGYIKPLVTGGTTAGVCLSTAIYVPDWHKHDLLPAVVVHGKSCIRRILRMPPRTGLQKPVRSGLPKSKNQNVYLNVYSLCIAN